MHNSFHTSLLRPYKVNDDRKFIGRALQKPGPVEEQNIYKIERILDYKAMRGRPMYNVH